MLNITQKQTIFRGRAQLTVPKKIRENAKWLKENMVITFTVPNDKQIIITTPENAPITAKTADWDKIFEGIKRARSYNGKRKGSLSDFIIKDRERHTI